jgi:uncharacterized membrane protein
LVFFVPFVAFCSIFRSSLYSWFLAILNGWFAYLTDATRAAVAQVANPARSPENAAFSGRFGNLRYVGGASRQLFNRRERKERMESEK